MAIIGPRKERKRPARIVSLVLSAMKNLANGDGCTIGKIVDYITDVGRQIATKGEVVAALKRGVEFGLMNKRRGRYFLKYNVDRVTRVGRKFDKIVINRSPAKKLTPRTIKRKLRRKKRRVDKTTYNNGLRRSTRKRPVKRLRKTRHLRTPNSYKFVDIYVNPSCRVSAKSSLASTQILEQEETESCA